ncbi:MAG: hypothetical protein SangKO_100010 [Sandaracinaceae bacterium]
MPRHAASAITRYALRYGAEGDWYYLLTLAVGELDQLVAREPLSTDSEGSVEGFARGVKASYVRDLTNAVREGSTMLGALLVELPAEAVCEVPARRVRKGEPAQPVTIVIPEGGRVRLLDGQHRLAALVEAGQVGASLPVVAVHALAPEARRDLHLRSNLRRPLQSRQLADLLPASTTPLPRVLQARRSAVELVGELARRPASPFCGLVRLSSTDDARAVVSPRTLESVLRRSLDVPSGCLFALRNLATGVDDTGAMVRLTFAFWNAVAAVFPHAWNASPAESRILSTPGLSALGRLMDASMGTVSPADPSLEAFARRTVESIRPLCRWTSGRWDVLGGLSWDDLGTDRRHGEALGVALVDAFRHSPRSHRP